MSDTPLDLSEERRQSLARLVGAWARHRPGAEQGAGSLPSTAEPWVEIRRAEMLRRGRPGILDVEATVDGRLAHAVLGLLLPGQEAHPLRSEEPALGLFEDEDGLAVVVDAVRDADLVPLVLQAVLTEAGHRPQRAPGVATAHANDGAATVIDFSDSCSLAVFPWPAEGPHPGVELLSALDHAGFNHLAAPLARWRRRRVDLGLVQELDPSRVDGWALALTSLRDLYGTGGRPEAAGGDFAPEARALGVMTARMHLALDGSYGRTPTEAGEWAADAAATIRRRDPGLLEEAGVEEVLAALSGSSVGTPALRIHGDLHLGRIARTDQGWVLADFVSEALSGDLAPERSGPPLADVAALLWSMHQVATVAAAERDPVPRPGVSSPAEAWAARNRRAFVSAYLATPGIGALVPSSPDVVRNLIRLFELVRATRPVGEPVG